MAVSLSCIPSHETPCICMYNEKFQEFLNQQFFNSTKDFYITQIRVNITLEYFDTDRIT